MSIELPEDYLQPARITLGQTLLRIALGGILVANGYQRLVHLGPFQDELASRFALLEPGAIAHAVIGAELVGGVLLICGWLTRLGALALLLSGAGSVVLEVMRQGGFTDYTAFEFPALLGVAALYFLLAGGGPASLDVALRARARRRAIQKDDLWLRHPYVTDQTTDEIEEYRPYNRRAY